MLSSCRYIEYKRGLPAVLRPPVLLLACFSTYRTLSFTTVILVMVIEAEKLGARSSCRRIFFPPSSQSGRLVYN